MDKKQLITVSALGVLIVALICFVVIYSGNTERLTKEQVLRIDDKIYEISDMEKYLRIASIESGDTNATFTDIDKENFCNYIYLTKKAYASAADKKKILFPEEELTKAKEDYAKKAQEFAAYGITEEDYIKYKEETYKEETLNNNFTTYFALVEDDYKEIIADYSGDDFKTYTYRLMKFTYEEPTSGESGDVLEAEHDEHDGHDHTEEVVEEEKEDRRKEVMLQKAENALNAVKNGEDFEKVAEEQADMDYTISENTLKVINGELLTQVVPVIQNQMSFSTGNLFVPAEVFEKMKTCEIGGYTEIIEVPDVSGYYFVKVENIEDGFVGEADQEFRKLLLQSMGQDASTKGYWDNMVNNIIDIEVNQAALTRFILK